MANNCFLPSLQTMRRFFNKSTSIFTEADAGFAPKPEMLSVAAHIAHAAFTIDWFVEGAFRPEGFDMDFAAQSQRVQSVKSLDAARSEFERACGNAERVIGAKSMDEMHMPLAAGPILGGKPRLVIIECVVEHTAHHRGSLAVYARLLGKVAPMPYAD